MEYIAGQLRQLHGPWVIGGDFNIDPTVMSQSGWLALIGGHLHATTTATCKNSNYDYFVVSESLHQAEAVKAVALVRDTTAKPHYAVRLFLQRNFRSLTRTVLRNPPKIDADLPRGCDNWHTVSAWEQSNEAEAADGAGSEASTADTLDGNFRDWFAKASNHCADICGIPLTGKTRDAWCSRADEPKLVRVPAAMQE